MHTFYQLMLVGPIHSLLPSCQNAGVFQIAPDRYMISRSNAAGAFANTPKMKADVVQEANIFAQRQGKVVVPLALNESRPAVGFPTCEYQLMVTDANTYERFQAATRKEWNSLTQAQRMDFTMRQAEIEFLNTTAAAVENQAQMSAVQGTMDRLSYDAHTRAVAAPVNVNVQANVNHNARGNVDVGGTADQNVNGTITHQHCPIS